jgi:hypothetical protein
MRKTREKIILMRKDNDDIGVAKIEDRFALEG